MQNTDEIKSFANECADTVSEALNDLEKLNIGLAKDKLYTLLKRSAELSESIESMKNSESFVTKDK